VEPDFEPLADVLLRLQGEFLPDTAWQRIVNADDHDVSVNFFADLTDVERYEIMIAWMLGFNACLDKICSEIDNLKIAIYENVDE
jgi:hypothetical protein